LEIGVFPGTGATRVTVVVPNVRITDADAFCDRVAAAYAEVDRRVRRSVHPRIVRMWNHIPGIHDAMTDGCDRYTTFNAGRFAAMKQWFGDRIAEQAPAASGVGHDGSDLVIHALAVDLSARTVENPDQVPAYRYSRQYGPVPPCFSRAMRAGRRLLISGTAAIRGEHSRYGGDLSRQFDLTLGHLKTLIAQAGGDGDLSLLDSVRVYVPRGVDRTTIQSLTDRAFQCDWDLRDAQLCRADLLVEIEAIATLKEDVTPS
jgi:enamine deaminase RidA (YjgF/YER057c/UK114 family)